MTSDAHWELPWSKRPTELAALYNPAFCGELLVRSTNEFRRLRGMPLPFPLAFVVLPLTLHPITRSALPGRADATFATWCAENDAILAEIPARTVQLRPVSREALLFLAQQQAVLLLAEGVTPGPRPLKLFTKLSASSSEAHQIRLAAGLLGRWFAHQRGASTILQSMGIRP
jgi:hypothetical protein